MARYDRIRGPSSTVDLASVTTLIPGFTITRTYGAGNLLVSYTTSVFNNTGLFTFNIFRVRLDGVEIVSSRQRVDVGVPHGSNISWTDIFTINGGRHTLELFGHGSVAAGNEINLGQTVLMVIELPHWDQEGGLVQL